MPLPFYSDCPPKKERKNPSRARKEMKRKKKRRRRITQSLQRTLGENWKKGAFVLFFNVDSILYLNIRLKC